MTPIRTILTDIEGTTSAIAFVKDTLFPFALAALDGFLDAHGAEPEVASIMAEVPGPDARATLRGWMAEDVKATPLKALQGLIDLLRQHFFHMVALLADEEGDPLARAVAVRAGDEGVEHFEAMDQPMLLQEIQRAVDGDRRGAAAGFGPQFLDEVIGTERVPMLQQRAQHIAALFRQARATRLAGSLRLRQQAKDGGFMIMPAAGGRTVQQAHAMVYRASKRSWRDYHAGKSVGKLAWRSCSRQSGHRSD